VTRQRGSNLPDDEIAYMTLQEFTDAGESAGDSASQSAAMRSQKWRQ
jgi:hypothetical protein